ncbi:MAG: protein kinase domain-containing protein [Burkholderiales bacterium]
MTPSNSADDDRTVMVGSAGAATGEAQPESLGHNALRLGTTLGEFEIIGLVGEGGFGIVYLAYDRSLDRKVALKEYMPSELAQRQGGTTVVVRSQRHAETFAAGMRSFINEARLLAQFDHPSLVKVYRFWEANGTAYMVMPYYEGITLKEALHRLGRPPDEEWLKSLLAQLLAALEIIHNRQCYHRDIAPDNILILPDGTPVLLDFGAARRVIGDMTQALTVILKPGYAPIEQYAEMPNMKQGPWTDLYALASVVYSAITGQTPVAAVARVMSDPLVPLTQAAAGRYSEPFLRAVDSALAVKPEDRPQDIAAFRRVLGLPERDAVTRYAPPDAALSAPGKRVGPRSVSTRKPTWIAAGGAAAVVLLLAAYLLYIYFDEPLPASPATAQAPTAETAKAPVLPPDAAPKATPADCEPYCQVASLLSPFASREPGVPGIGIKGGGTAAYEGEKLVAEATAADFQGYMYIDLYDPEGSVAHMLPNAKEKKNQLPPRQRIVVGDDPMFGMQWDVVPPFGRHMLVVMVSRTPLFNKDRRQVESAADYLRALRERLSGKAGDEALVAHYSVIEIKPKR